MSNEVEAMTGTATLLNSAGLATYNVAGYSAGQTGVFFKKMPASPDRVVVITAYMLANLPDGPLDQINLQLRYRGVPDNETDVDELGGNVFNFLHGKKDFPLGALHVIQCLQRSSLPMGIDDNNRWERSDNYALDVDVPATVNRPL